MSIWRFKYELTTDVWTDCTPDATACTVQIKREGMRRKDAFSGTMIFYNTDFDTLYALRNTKFQIQIRVYKKNVLFISGYIRLFKGKFDLRNKKATLEVAQKNLFYDNIENNWEKPLDILLGRQYSGEQTATYETSGVKNMLYFNILEYNESNIPVGIDCLENPPPDFNYESTYLANDRVIFTDGIVYKCKFAYSSNPSAWTSQGYVLGKRVYKDVVIGIDTIRTIWECKLTHTTGQEPKETLNNDDYWFVVGTNNIHFGHSTPVSTAWNSTTSYVTNDIVNIVYSGKTYYFKAKQNNINQQPPATVQGNAYWEFYYILVVLIAPASGYIQNSWWIIDGKWGGESSFSGITAWLNIQVGMEYGYYRIGDLVDDIYGSWSYRCIAEHISTSETKNCASHPELWEDLGGWYDYPEVIEYNGTGKYIVGQKVSFDGYYWECISNITHNNQQPPTQIENITENTWWRFLYPKENYWTRRAYPIYDPDIMEVENGLFLIASCSNSVYDFIVSHGIKLHDALKYLVQTTDPDITVETNQLSSNYCLKYLLNFDYLKNILVFDKSDVKYTEASDQALFEMITLKKFLEILQAMFKLDWMIEEVSGTKYFKMVHPSEMPTSVWLDLTNYQSKDWTININEFSSTGLAINKLGLEFEKSSNQDFDYGYQQYDVLESAVNTIALQEVCNNVGAVYSLGSDFADTGLCFVACKTDYDIYDEPAPIVNTGVFANAPLSASRLVYDHWNYSGAYPLCTVNGIEEQALTAAIGTYTTEKIDFPLDIEDIDINGLVVTDLSKRLGRDGFYINTITQKLDNDFAEITLEF